MNFEFNKIAGAVLGTALGVMVVGIVADTIYAPHAPAQPGYVIAVAEPVEGEGEAPAAPEVVPIADRLQVASVEKGAAAVAKCKTCHNFEKGAPNKVGPNLWDVVGHNVIHGDFSYSDAMREKGEEGMEWTYANLDGFLTSPRGYIPGTAMAFAGIRNPDERADIIAYMRTLADNPEPLPPPTPPAETPPAAGENPPAATESPTPEAPAEPPAAEAPPAGEQPAPPPAVEPAPAPETEQPMPAPEPAPAPEETVPAPVPEQPAPAPEAPAPEAPAPAQDQPASSGTSEGAAPAPAPDAMAPTAPVPDAEAESPEGAPAAPAPDAEAESPEGAPAPEAPAPDAEAESPEGAPAPKAPAQ